ncbi:MAG: metallophosphoesterase [Chloroflexi bacterium]|nr:MAG: metallophosphoesterase [Chloroflexota bacterium]
MKIAAIADLHVHAPDDAVLSGMFKDIEKDADVLLICGDLTDNGKANEAGYVVEYLQQLSIPVIAVLGNHDHEGGQAEEIALILQDAGVTILDGTTREIDGVGFAGTKGFCGGFGSLFVQPFGEKVLKEFINASIEEAVQLENALAKLSCPVRIVLLHYSPIRDTLEGEPLELFPFLGTSRLANAIDRHGANLIFHGHAHHGSPNGATAANIPVYNVSRFVLSKNGNRGYCLLEV